MTGSDLTENNGDSTILQLPVQVSDISNCKENKILENDICVTYGKGIIIKVLFTFKLFNLKL